METFQFNSRKWIKIALINFSILALAGVVLRYKINFPLPLINQKYLLHGHSHFAFGGWITLALITLMVNYLIKSGYITNYKKYNRLLIANTVTAYGMLITFIIQGYGLYSITFSTLSVFVSYFFCYYYWKDLNQIKAEKRVVIWFKLALILWVISSLGAFGLAYLMASHILVQEFYFAAIYFFLHFQYNGWFIFTCFGLLFSFLFEKNEIGFKKTNTRLFLVLAITVIPSYLLSIFGLKIPIFLYWLGTISAIIQLAALFYGYKLLKEIRVIPLTKMTKFLWTLAYLSYTLKIILQALSTIPYFGSFAFSLKPLIIGYLHLCFLGVISFFILGYFNELLHKQGIQLNKSGLWLLIVGVILQEIILMVQALSTMMQLTSGNTNILLFIAAIVMATGLSILIRIKR